MQSPDFRAARWLLLIPATLLLACAASPPPKPGAPVRIPLDRQGGTYYVEGAFVGLQSARFLVDTGSKHMVIDDTMRDRLRERGAARYSHDLRATMADGSQPVIEVYDVAGLRIGDCWIGETEAAVFPDSQRLILGMDVLEELAPFTFSVDPPALVLGRCQRISSLPVRAAPSRAMSSQRH
jgi:predicted aspartyl protease